MSTLKANNIQHPSASNPSIQTNSDGTADYFGGGAASKGKLAFDGPAFCYTRSLLATLTNNTYTKIACPTKVFDTHNAYDNTTNYRFQPTIAGYYQITVQMSAADGASGNTIHAAEATLYKNGSIYIGGNYTYAPAAAAQVIVASSTFLVFLNGSTDYVELWGRIIGSGTVKVNDASISGFLARAA